MIRHCSAPLCVAVQPGSARLAAPLHRWRQHRWHHPFLHPLAGRGTTRHPWACLDGVPLPACSKELILQLIRGINSDAALAALPMVTLSSDALGEAIAAAAARRSLRGVRALLAHARDAGLASGLEARGLWRAAIVAFGALGRPGEARRAFVDMRAAGAWELSDTPTVNLLLNALAGDISVQFTRCGGWRGSVKLRTPVLRYPWLAASCRAAYALVSMSCRGPRTPVLLFLEEPFTPALCCQPVDHHIRLRVLSLQVQPAAAGGACPRHQHLQLPAQGVHAGAGCAARPAGAQMDAGRRREGRRNHLQLPAQGGSGPCACVFVGGWGGAEGDTRARCWPQAGIVSG